jgi:NAD(P)-dependent dehydrogenase (short-subunit alcohol dehydrogenase family)
VVLRLLADGARVVTVDVDVDALEALQAEVDGQRSLLTRRADVTDEAVLGTVILEAVSTWGGLDVVIANAAIEPSAENNFLHEIETATLRRIVVVNLVGMALTCKLGLQALLSTGGGSVVSTPRRRAPTG